MLYKSLNYLLAYLLHNSVDMTYVEICV